MNLALIPVLASVQIDVDVTVVPQFVIFCLVLILLNFILVQPYLEAREAREQGVSGSREEAQDMEEQAEAKMEEYETRLTKARREAMEAREELRQEGLVRQSELMAEAREDVAGVIQRERVKIENLVDAAQKEISKNSKDLAKQMVNQVLPNL